PLLERAWRLLGSAEALLEGLAGLDAERFTENPGRNQRMASCWDTAREDATSLVTDLRLLVLNLKAQAPAETSGAQTALSAPAHDAATSHGNGHRPPFVECASGFCSRASRPSARSTA